MVAGELRRVGRLLAESVFQGVLLCVGDVSHPQSVGHSEASDLVADDNNGFADIFLRDMATGLTTRISVDVDGDDANQASRVRPDISGDHRHVVFASNATDLVSDGGDTFDNIYVRDLR